MDGNLFNKKKIEVKIMKNKVKYQVLLRGGTGDSRWIIRRDSGEYGYRIEGDVTFSGNTYECSLPLNQGDVARIFKDEGKEWRWE